MSVFEVSLIIEALEALSDPEASPAPEDLLVLGGALELSPEPELLLVVGGTLDISLDVTSELEGPLELLLASEVLEGLLELDEILGAVLL